MKRNLLNSKNFNELEEAQNKVDDMVLKLQMDKIKHTNEYLEGEDAIRYLKLYINE